MVEEKLNEAFKKLETKQYDNAINLFEELIEKEGYEAEYGLATALFRKGTDTFSLDHDTVDKVISLYQDSLLEKPDYADAYLMLGLVYMKKASLLLKEFKERHDIKLTDEALSCLDKAKVDFEKSIRYNEKFRWTAEENLKSIERNRKTIKRFKEKYVD